MPATSEPSTPLDATLGAARALLGGGVAGGGGARFLGATVTGGRGYGAAVRGTVVGARVVGGTVVGATVVGAAVVRATFFLTACVVVVVTELRVVTDARGCCTDTPEAVPQAARMLSASAAHAARTRREFVPGIAGSRPLKMGFRTFPATDHRPLLRLRSLPCAPCECHDFTNSRACSTRWRRIH
jgi:hypothetical protein